MKKLTTFSAGAIVMALVLVPAFAQQTGRQGAGTQNRDNQTSTGATMNTLPIRGTQSAKNFIGARIVDQSGRDLGTVSDLMFDQNGQLQSVVVSGGTFTGTGQANNYTLPWDSIKMSSQLGTYITTANASQMQASSTTPSMSQTGGSWIGKSVIGSNDDSIGSIQDVYVRNNQVSYLLVSGADNKLHPVPVSLFTIDPSQDRLKLNVSKSQFDSSPSYSQNDLMQGSTNWQASTDNYYQGFQGQAPVSRRMQDGQQGTTPQGGTR